MQSTAIQPSQPLTDSAVKTPRTRKRTVQRSLYAFDDCPPARMIRICCLLRDRGFHSDSTLYIMPHSRRFYLSLEEPLPPEGAPLPPTVLLEEFGVRIASASMLCCLDEHARCLCAHDAVETIAALSV